MTSVLRLAACALSLFFLFSCGKNDSKADQNRSLLIGTWNYTSSERSVTTFNTNGTSQDTSTSVYSSGNTNRNHITFMDNNQAILVEDAFGPGLSGALFADTVSYHVLDNAVLLMYPAGINSYYYPPYNYNAYMDTLSISFLSADSLSFTRKYHYKHLVAPTELKTANAHLRKQ